MTEATIAYIVCCVACALILIWLLRIAIYFNQYKCINHTANHEAGHAIAAEYYCEGSVERIIINKRLDIISYTECIRETSRLIASSLLEGHLDLCIIALVYGKSINNSKISNLDMFKHIVITQAGIESANLLANGEEESEYAQMESYRDEEEIKYMLTNELRLEVGTKEYGFMRDKVIKESKRILVEKENELRELATVLITDKERVLEGQRIREILHKED